MMQCGKVGHSFHQSKRSTKLEEERRAEALCFRQLAAEHILFFMHAQTVCDMFMYRVSADCLRCCGAARRRAHGLRVRHVPSTREALSGSRLK